MTTLSTANLSGSFFVTGTDTGVGKTWVCCRLLEKARQQGLSAYGLKPLAAGAEQHQQQWQNEDALALQAVASVDLPYEQINPLVLQAAIAPHIAAADENRRLSADQMAGYVRGVLMSHPAKLKLVEGAGGWRVPLNDRETLARLAQLLELPVILVVGMKLGCLNHALLTAEAIRRDGLQLAAWVANDLGDPMPRLVENIATLDAMLPAPQLVLDTHDAQENL